MKSDGTYNESEQLARQRAARARNEADDMQRENRRLRDLLAFTERENAQLRERLQVAESKLALAESTAACGNALASFVFGDEWPMVSAAVAGGMAALKEARR